MASSARRRRAVPSSAQQRPAEGFPATITALRPAFSHERAESICDVIDAFRRLRDSIGRLSRLLAPATPTPANDPSAAGASLLPLLAALARHGDGAHFARRRELRRAIRDARALDRTRDALFTDAFCLDTAAMWQTVAELERLDAAFVTMGVAHVLERHAETPAAAPRIVRQTGRRLPRAATRPAGPALFIDEATA